MDFSQSVIMPRDDFQELVTVAFNQPPATPGERIATTIQTSLVFAGMAAAFSVGTWAWYKMMSKLEDQKLANKITEIEETQKIQNQQ